MNNETLRTREFIFAFLFGPARLISRNQAGELHGRLCDSLRLDDFSFHYESTELQAGGTASTVRPFKIQFARRDGSGLLGAVIECTSLQEPMRLLLKHSGPPSLETTCQYFDTLAEALIPLQEWQRVHAEARILTQCQPRVGGSAVDFLKNNLLRFSAADLEQIGGSLSFCGLKFDVPATGETDSLSGPSRQVQVEVLREDPGSVYIEVITAWTQWVQRMQGHIPVLDVSAVRQIDQAPSKYLRDCYDFLSDKVCSLGRGGG